MDFPSGNGIANSLVIAHAGRGNGVTGGKPTEGLVRLIAASVADAQSTRSPSHPIILKVAIMAGVIAAVMSTFPHAARAQLPTINIQQTCQIASKVMVNLMGGSTTQNDVEICLETENKARQQMLKDWSTYQPSDRAGCVQANVYLPSYVEWITCFEMNKVVREARQQGRAMSSLTNADGSMTLPRVRSGRPY
jgi:hypothetical protein